jgi:hypothetical protein
MALMFMGLGSPASSFDLIIPDTGQQSCYDWDAIMCDQFHNEAGFYEVCDSNPCPVSEGEDFFGQDAQYTINPPELTNNGNGTVTDNLTGLMWEQKTEANEQATVTYDDAVAYCDTLSLGDHDDWRLPDRKEYATLLNLNRLSPALDKTYFPYYTGNPSAIHYWTASPYHDDPAKVWTMQIAWGIIETGSKDTLYKVRCVRGSTAPSPSYTDNANGTVTDNLTGLMWEQKTDDGGSRDKDNTYTWKDALAYCENLILANFSDWRLPNPKELERLVETSSSRPSVDTSYFPHTSNGLYWTGTSCVGCHKFKAFAYNFSDGSLNFGVKYRDGEYPENYTRCVRTADDTPGTTTAVSTTTSSEPGNPCAVEEIYGEHSAQAALLRGFRDSVMSKTSEGRALVELYYQWSPIIVQAIRKDDQLREEIKALMAYIVGNIDIR